MRMVTVDLFNSWSVEVHRVKQGSLQFSLEIQRHWPIWQTLLREVDLLWSVASLPNWFSARIMRTAFQTWVFSVNRVQWRLQYLSPLQRETIIIHSHQSMPCVREVKVFNVRSYLETSLFEQKRFIVKITIASHRRNREWYETSEYFWSSMFQCMLLWLMMNNDGILGDFASAFAEIHPYFFGWPPEQSWGKKVAVKHRGIVEIKRQFNYLG